jgi:hypothetical protein
MPICLSLPPLIELSLRGLCGWAVFLGFMWVIRLTATVFYNNVTQLRRDENGEADDSSEARQVSTYCYQCVNGSNLPIVDVVDGEDAEVESNLAMRGIRPADGKICITSCGLLEKLYNRHRIRKSVFPLSVATARCSPDGL